MNNFLLWLKSAAIRAVRTFAQTAISLIGVSVFMSDVNWQLVLSGACLAAITSLLTSAVTGLPEVEAAIREAAENQFDTNGEGQ